MQMASMKVRVPHNQTTAMDDAQGSASVAIGRTPRAIGGSAENAGAIFCKNELEQTIGGNVAKLLGTVT